MPAASLRMVATVCVCLVAIYGSVAHASTKLDPSAVDAWKKFRAAQPFQTQLIALSPAAGNKVRTLIVAEPPPRLTKQEVMRILGRHVESCDIKEWSVMAGGLVRDLVCTIVNVNGEEWREQLGQLQLAVYGSIETPVATLPVPARKMIAHSLDARFSARDLHGWATNHALSYRSSPLGLPAAFKDILAAGTPGVFTSNDRSLVLWVIDRNRSIDGLASDIRRFSVAGDLVLGAIANSKTAVIVARGRMESLSHLPPLRSETVLLLAGSSEKALAQSYERTDPISGKGVDSIDRAPILLSPQLVDSEFGTLLNIADQLLKRWSRAGTLRYERFVYPDPKSYPYGKVPVRSVHPGRAQFLYNWNTDGAAYRESIGGIDVIVPQRTGALSVIYGDIKDRPRDLEDVAYDYFARSGDTTLVRVVQYTLLFQVFRQFDVKAATPRVSPRFAEFRRKIDEVTRQQFKFLLDEATESELRTMARMYWTATYRNVPDTTFSERRITRERAVSTAVDNTTMIVQALQQAQRSSQGSVDDALSEVVGAFRAREQLSQERKDKLDAAERTLTTYVKPPKLIEFLFADDGKGLRASGLLQMSMAPTKGWETLGGTVDPASTWIHTAYVVESRGLGSATSATGGHNIDAPVTRFVADAAQQRGAVSLVREPDGSFVVKHHPDDADRLRTITREVGTSKGLTEEAIKADVARALKDRPPEPPVALRDVRGVTGKSAEFKRVDTADGAYQIRAVSPTQNKVLEELAAGSQDAIIMEQLPGGTFQLSRPGAAEALHVNSVTAATDVLANALISSAQGRGGVPVLLKGIPDAKAEAMMSFVQSGLRRRSRNSVDQVLAMGPEFSVPVERARFLNEKIAHNGLRVDRQGIKVTQVTQGIYQGYSRVDVPVTITAKTPWHVRIVLFIKDATAATVEAIANSLSQVLLAMRGPVSPLEMRAAIRRQLRTDLKDLDVDSVLLHFDSDPTNKVHDVLIAKGPRGAA